MAVVSLRFVADRFSKATETNHGDVTKSQFYTSSCTSISSARLKNLSIEFDVIVAFTVLMASFCSFSNESTTPFFSKLPIVLRSAKLCMNFS